MKSRFPKCRKSNKDDAASPSDEHDDCRYPEAEHVSDTLLDALLYGALFLSADGMILRASKQALQELHLDESIVGRRLADVLSVFNRETDILPGIFAELQNGSELVVLSADTFIEGYKESFHLFIRGHFVRLNEREVLFTFRNVEEELTRDFMLKMALSSTRIFPWFYDRERDTMVIDARYFEYTGIPSEDNTMTLEAFSERLHPEDRGLMAHAFGLQLKGVHYPYPVSFRLKRGDGTWEWFEGQSSYLGQVKGIPYRVVGICMSTQAHKDIEEALIAARDKAERSDRLKSAFLANMSHEIRTPLNAIVGFSHELVSEYGVLGAEEASEFGKLISANSDHLLMLISDILDLSKIESGTMEFNYSEQSASELMNDIYRMQELQLRPGVKLLLDLPEMPVSIHTDPMRLRQVINNLINNAVKFTMKGSIVFGCRPQRDGNAIEFFVKDTGSGIVAEKQEAVFDRFVKLDSFVPGTGLGLSICKSIVEKMGGRIGVDSQPGEGSTFYFSLPRNNIRETDSFSA